MYLTGSSAAVTRVNNYYQLLEDMIPSFNQACPWSVKILWIYGHNLFPTSNIRGICNKLLTQRILISVKSPNFGTGYGHGSKQSLTYS